MPTLGELLNMERKGELSPEQVSALGELRRRGGVPPALGVPKKSSSPAISREEMRQEAEWNAEMNKEPTTPEEIAAVRTAQTAPSPFTGAPAGPAPTAKPAPPAGQGVPAGLRAKLSFARTPEGRTKMLEGAYGAGNVRRLSMGEFEFRKGPDQPWEYIRESGLTLMSFLDYVGELPEIIGGLTVGGIGLLGGPGAGVIGAGLGGAMGRSIRAGIAEEPVSVSDLAQSAAEQSMGQVLGSAPAKFAAPFAKGLLSEAPMASRLLRARGQRLLPSEATSSTALDIAHNIVEHGFTSRPIIMNFKAKRNETIKQMADEIANLAGPYEKQQIIGKAFTNAKEFGEDIFQAAATKLYGQLDQAVGAVFAKVPTQVPRQTEKLVDEFGQPFTIMVTEYLRTQVAGAKVPTDEVIGFLAQQLSKREGVPRIGQAGVRQLLQDVKKIPNTWTFEQAQTFRSDLLSELRRGGQYAEGVGKGIAEQLVKKTDIAMETASKALDPVSYKLWRNVNEFYKTGAQRFRNDFINSLIEKNPEDIGKAIFTKGGVTEIELASAVVDPKTWERVRAGFYQSLIEDVTDVSTKEIQGKKLLTLIKGYGPDMLEKVAGPRDLDAIKRFATTVDLVQSKQGAKEGSMLIQLTQGGLLLAPFVRPSVGTIAAAGTVFLGLPVIAKIMASKGGAQWLAEGFHISTTSKAASHFIARAGVLGISRYLKPLENPQESEQPTITPGP